MQLTRLRKGNIVAIAEDQVIQQSDVQPIQHLAAGQSGLVVCIGRLGRTHYMTVCQHHRRAQEVKSPSSSRSQPNIFPLAFMHSR